jgi:two-component system, OmpR family, response regulator BaeR
MSDIERRDLILIVEDEPKIAALLTDYLLASGYRCQTQSTGLGVDDAVREAAPALMLLDVMLPGKDGLTICREVRAWSTLPIIMLTARVEDIDRLLGLELGADDYICKPFNPREVVARVKAVLRRAHAPVNAPVNAPVDAGLVLDAERFEVRIDGHALTLTPVEFRLLRALSARPGHVLSRDRLVAAAYDDHRVVSDRTIDSHIKNLRRKMSDANGGVDRVRSIYGVGFKLD